MALVAALMAIVAVQAIDCYYHNMLWPSQVLARWGKPGIAFILHAAMWSDFLILPWLCLYITRHLDLSHIPSGRQVTQMLALGLGVTAGNQLLLMFTQELPDPIGWKGQWISLTIVLHFFYMSIAVTCVGLFYFYGTTDMWPVVLVSILLGIHSMAGMHIFIGVLQRYVHLVSVPDFLASTLLPYLASAVWVALAALATYAAGWAAGAAVTLTALGLGSLIAVLIHVAPVRP